MSVRHKPVVKWAGGKSKLINQLIPFFPCIFLNYHEPFLGSGAVFFYLFSDLAVKKAESFISDLNSELINLYEVIRDNVYELIEDLKVHKCNEKYYYEVRNQDPLKLKKVKRASRMLFLNKTCFNGLWRVNRNGQFNVSFGRYINPKIFEESELINASIALRYAKLFCADFEIVLKNAQCGDFVYLDPPYYPISPSSNFTSYTSNSFSKADHLRLREVFEELKKRGCFVALSNSNVDVIRELYKGCNIKTIRATRAINSDITKRKAIAELLILSYPDTVCRLDSCLVKGTGLR